MNAFTTWVLGKTYPRFLSIDLGLLVIRVAIGLALCTLFEKSLPRTGHWGPQEWLVSAIEEMG
jgi:hypothetical protein